MRKRQLMMPKIGKYVTLMAILVLTLFTQAARAVLLEGNGATTSFNVSDYTATVTSSALNVRSCASTSCRVLGKRNKGQTVRVTHHNGVWRRIAWVSGQSAYVHGNYLRKSTGASPNGNSTGTSSDSDVSNYTATVTASALNVRSCASTACGIIRQLKKGNTVSVTHHSGQWRRIDWTGGRRAYVHGNYLQSGSLNAGPPDSTSENNSENPYAAADAGSLGVTTGSNNPYAAADKGSLDNGMTSGKPSCENPRQCDGSEPYAFGSSAWASTLSDSELQQRIDNWQGTDNDPILDRLVSERNARLDKPENGASGGRNFQKFNNNMTENFNNLCTNCDELFNQLYELLRLHGKPPEYPEIYKNGISGLTEYVFTHKTVSEMISDLASREYLSDTEKAYIWDKFAYLNSKEPTTDNGNEFVSRTINAESAHPLVINADIRGSGNTHMHTVVGFTDGTHGPWVKLPIDEAYQQIVDKENSLGSRLACVPFCPNKGDMEASLRTVIAMKRYDETQNFEEFARYWKGLFLENGDDLCLLPIAENGCPTLGIEPLIFE